MNILFWILQGAMALHTLMGAIWKFSHSEQAVPSLKSIPHSVWLLLIVLEILCAVALVLPAVSGKTGMLVPVAALVIAGEMLLFCVVHLSSGNKNKSEIIYWVVVAVICAFLAYGRLVMKPL